MQVIIQSHLTNKLYWMQESGTRWYYLSVPDAVHPLAIEYEADDATADVVLDDKAKVMSAPMVLGGKM